MDRLDDGVGFGRHNREQRVVADVGRLLAASIAGPRSPDPGEEEWLLVGALEPAPHHGALRRVPVGLGEGRRRHDAAMLAVKPAAPQMVPKAAEVGAVAGARLERRKAPQHVLTHDALAILLDHHRRWAIRIDVQGFVADALRLFKVRADEPVVLDQVADFPRCEGVEIAHEDQPSTGSVVFGVQRFVEALGERMTDREHALACFARTAMPPPEPGPAPQGVPDWTVRFAYWATGVILLGIALSILGAGLVIFWWGTR